MAVPTAELSLEAANRCFDGAPPEETIAWAAEQFGDGLVLASSFNDCVLIDLVARFAPQVPIVFLDTQYHFTETLEYVEQVRAHYGLDVEIVRPLIAPDNLWQTDTDACCAARKVEPLGRALRNRTAWLSGLRRAEAVTRASAPVVSWDSRWQAVKINPIVALSDAEVQRYASERNLPEHPLKSQGYRSIGCWPCTRPTADGEDPRAGRWSGSDKLECGLHLTAS
jgi:phosphoadenosine phosphosulfate reductase